MFPDSDTAACGWRAHLQLRFAARTAPENRGGQGGHAARTVLLEKRHEGPMLVQRPFYPEGEAVCHVYLLHPPGGVVGGDILQLDVRVESSAHTLITMPGATKFYRSAGPQATLGQHFSLDDGARLEWLPQDTILFPGARARTETRFDLHGSARLTGWETLCLGRPVMHEAFDRGELVSRFAVYRDGQPLLHEHLRIQGGHLAKLAGQPLLSTLVFTPADACWAATTNASSACSSSSGPPCAPPSWGWIPVRRASGAPDPVMHAHPFARQAGHPQQALSHLLSSLPPVFFPPV